MSGPMGGPGLGLQPPQNLYPSQLNNSPYDASSNQVTLAAGDAITVPRGTNIISLGSYCSLQYYDPVNNTWQTFANGGWGGPLIIDSDGFNVRVANMLGCPVGGIVNAYGSGWVQASTTIAVVGGGGSTWQPVVGGQLALVGATLTSNGAGYGVAPLVFIPPPPPPANNANGVGGVQATGFCTIASGTVSGFTFTNVGAGYPVAPTPVIVPNPTDPNINTGITQASMAFSLTGSGSITAALCTNPGAPLATPNNITLTLSGAGSSGTVSAIMQQTVVAVSVVGGSTIAGASVSALVSSSGGYPASAGPATPITGTVTSGPQYLVAGAVSIGGTGGYGLWARPRPLQALLSVGAAGTIAAQAGIIYDGGLFYSVPNPQMVGLTNLAAAVNGTIVGSSTLALTMGSRPDICWIQPLKV